MEVTVSSQLAEAGAGLLCGVFAGVLYDLLRVLRRSVKGRAVTFVTGAVVWMAAAFMLFALGLSAGGGRQRLFLQLMAALGAVLYFLTVSPPILAFGAFLAAVVGRILFILAAPLRVLKKSFEKFRRILKKTFSSVKKRFTIILTNKRRASAPEARDTEDAAKTYRYAYEDRAGSAADLRAGDKDRPKRSGKAKAKRA